MELENKTRIALTYLKELTAAGEGLAVISTFNQVDYDGDVTLPGTFGNQIVSIVPSHHWQHVPLGKARVHEKAASARAFFKLNLDIPAARDWHSAMRFDLEHLQPPVLEWSYSFRVLDAEMGELAGKRVRFLKKLRLDEISPVLRGASVSTRTLALKVDPALQKQTDEIVLNYAALLDRFIEGERKRRSEVVSNRRHVAPMSAAELRQSHDTAVRNYFALQGKIAGGKVR